jgi:hypothetical protein
MFTNRQDALPLWEGDRRIYVVRCADAPKPPAYYTQLYGRLKDPGFLAAVWHALKARDLTGFNPGMRAPLNAVKRSMIAAARSDEQQAAADLVAVCPHDLVTGADLMQVLAPRRSDDVGDRSVPEPRRDHEARIKAVAAVLKELGCQTWQGSKSGKVAVGRTSSRVWILRNPGKWSAATVAAMRPVFEAAHNDITRCGHMGDACLKEWGGNED